MAREWWQVQSDLEYYLGYRPTDETVAEAMDYLASGHNDLAAWVDAMIEIGAL